MSLKASLPRLGRGLESLIPSDVRITKTQEGGITYLLPSQLTVNPYQPRQEFDEERLTSLADSIKQHGLNQPILVRRVGSRYEIVAGERRYRACIMSGIDRIPVIVKALSDQESLQLALIENLEREDLNAIEEAQGYERLKNEFSMTQDDLSRIFSKSRQHIGNIMRLLRLPSEIQDAVRRGDISMGHARTLITLPDELTMIKVYKAILQNNLSVRATEGLVMGQHQDPAPAKISGQAALFPEIETRLGEKFDAKIKITGKASRGKIVIHYDSESKLREILNRIG